MSHTFVSQDHGFTLGIPHWRGCEASWSLGVPLFPSSCTQNVT
jgi:hypothetical protein